MLKYLDMPCSEWLPQEPTEIASTCGISHKKSGVLRIIYLGDLIFLNYSVVSTWQMVTA